MKEKHVIVINGKGGSGKDTLYQFAAKRWNSLMVSSIDPIKEAAKVLNWDGSKQLKDRKFLADLKELSIKYNDYPNTHLLNYLSVFLKNSYFEILFVCIREPDEIKKFVDSVYEKYNYNPITLLIRRNGLTNDTYGNTSDDNVENYPYNVVYDNDKTLALAETDFNQFLLNVLNARKGQGISYIFNY